MTDGQSEACEAHAWGQRPLQPPKPGDWIGFVPRSIHAFPGTIARLESVNTEGNMASISILTCDSLEYHAVPYNDVFRVEPPELQPGDWVKAIADIDMITIGDVGWIVHKTDTRYWVHWCTGPASFYDPHEEWDGSGYVDKQDVVKTSKPRLLSAMERIVDDEKSVSESTHASHTPFETNARRLLRMVHQWAVCDGRYKGGNLWREVERELS